MSTPLQPIWLIDPIEPPTDPVLVVGEIPDPLTEAIPIQRPRQVNNAPERSAARRSVPPSPQPQRGTRNLIAVVLMLVLLLGGAAAAISAFF